VLRTGPGKPFMWQTVFEPVDGRRVLGDDRVIA